MKNKFFSYCFKFFFLFFSLIFFSTNGFTQDKYYPEYFNKKIDTNKIQFRGYFGYFFASGEVIKVDSNFLTKLLINNSIPVANPLPAFQIATLGFMYNRLYSSFRYSYSIADNEKKKDTLKSVLRQSSFSLTFGYNVFRKKYEWETFAKKDSAVQRKSFAFVITPYVGIKVFRFRHITSYVSKNITLDQYLNFPGYDLRVIQFTCPVGVNATFLLNNWFSFGFYSSYLFHLHEYPIIKATQDRIKTNINGPVKNFNFGMGCGFGFNHFYRNKIYKETEFDVF